MIKYLLPDVPKFFKANFHTHTTISDGKLSPEEMVAAYKERGYSVLAITDHSVCVSHRELNSDDLLLLTGVEIDVEEIDNPVNERDRCIHMCLISKDPNRQWIPFKDPRPNPSSVPYEALNEIGSSTRAYNSEDINKIIAECNREGYLVTYNHPTWSLESYPEYSQLKGLWGMEYRNSDSIAIGFDENNGRVYHDLSVLGNRIVPVCADDTHVLERDGHSVIGDGWNMIAAEELTYKSVIEAMEKGDLYASCGPEIHSLTWDGTNIHITCSPAAKIQLVAESRFARIARDDNATLTEATFDIGNWVQRFAKNNKDAFIRLIVTDERGRYAVTRAYFSDELQCL